MRRPRGVYSEAGQCKGKLGFGRKADAKLKLRRMRHGLRRGQVVYRCPWCGLYHLGHER